MESYTSRLLLILFIIFILAFVTHLKNQYKPNQVKVKPKKIEAYFEDFEDKFPRETIFAYIWYAIDLEDFCAAFVAFKRLKKLRDYKTLHQVDYVLTYISDNSDNDYGTSNSKIIHMLEHWTKLGGVLSNFQLTENASQSKK